MSSNASLILTDSYADRFWSEVDVSAGPEACWPWTGATNTDGYGQLSVNGKVEYTHRIACELKHGPLGKLHALHSCDNPPCCNPNHLNPGTNKLNADDRDAKGRHAHGVSRGVDSGTAKLDDERVLTIRRLVGEGQSQRVVAKQLGVSVATVNRVAARKSWSHV